MANRLFQAFIDTAKTIAGYPITVANGVFMRNGKTLDETQEEFNTILGTTDISNYGAGTVTGAIKSACDKADVNEVAIADVNSNLEKLVIISQSIELENNVSSFTLIKSGFSKPPKTMYVLLDALEPNKSGAYVKLYLNNQGDLYTTKESVISGTWYINGAYISV